MCESEVCLLCQMTLENKAGKERVTLVHFQSVLSTVAGPVALGVRRGRISRHGIMPEAAPDGG